VIDSVEGATDQDAAIAGEADKAGSGIIIAANKWDLMKGRGAEFSKEFDEKLRRQVKFLDYAPILHISAATGERASKVLETIDQVADARTRRIPTSELNRFVAAVTAVHPPSSPGRREVRILYAAQTGIEPPRACHDETLPASLRTVSMSRTRRCAPSASGLRSRSLMTSCVGVGDICRQKSSRPVVRSAAVSARNPERSPVRTARSIWARSVPTGSGVPVCAVASSAISTIADTTRRRSGMTGPSYRFLEAAIESARWRAHWPGVKHMGAQ
jgi:hypothetical protein